MTSPSPRSSWSDNRMYTSCGRSLHTARQAAEALLLQGDHAGLERVFLEMHDSTPSLGHAAITTATILAAKHGATADVRAVTDIASTTRLWTSKTVKENPALQRGLRVYTASKRLEEVEVDSGKQDWLAAVVKKLLKRVRADARYGFYPSVRALAKECVGAIRAVEAYEGTECDASDGGEDPPDAHAPAVCAIYAFYRCMWHDKPEMRMSIFSAFGAKAAMAALWARLKRTQTKKSRQAFFEEMATAFDARMANGRVDAGYILLAAVTAAQEACVPRHRPLDLAEEADYLVAKHVFDTAGSAGVPPAAPTGKPPVLRAPIEDGLVKICGLLHLPTFAAVMMPSHEAALAPPPPAARPTFGKRSKK